MTDRYVLTGGLLDKLRNTVRTVDEMFSPADATTRLVTHDHEDKPRPVRLGTFGTSAWSLGSDNTVTLTNVGVTGYTVLATNVFGSLSAMGSTTAGTTRPCAITRDGTSWYLIQPVPQSGGAKSCTFTGEWGRNTDKVVTAIVTGETINVTNIIYTIPDTGGSLDCIVVQEGTAFQLANVQHLSTSVLTKVSITGSSLVFDRAGIQVVGQTSSPTTFPLATCNTYSGSTVSATAVSTSSSVASFSSTSFFLG